MAGIILIVLLLVLLAVQIASAVTTGKEMKWIKERTDDLLLRTHRLEHPNPPAKKFMTTAGEVSVDITINKEEFDEQIDQITEDLDAIHNQTNETLKNARELRSILDGVRQPEEEPRFHADGKRYWPAEEKREITRRLFEVLKLCDYTDGIIGMDYVDQSGDEYVRIFYGAPGRYLEEGEVAAAGKRFGAMKKIDITADSGFALIKDVIRGIEEGPYE